MVREQESEQQVFEMALWSKCDHFLFYTDLHLWPFKGQTNKQFLSFLVYFCAVTLHLNDNEYVWWDILAANCYHDLGIFYESWIDSFKRGEKKTKNRSMNTVFPLDYTGDITGHMCGSVIEVIDFSLCIIDCYTTQLFDNTQWWACIWTVMEVIIL